MYENVSTMPVLSLTYKTATKEKIKSFLVIITLEDEIWHVYNKTGWKG